MKARNQHSETFINWQYIAKASFVICFVLLAGFAFQTSLHTEGCISLLMAWFTPILLGEEL